MARSREQLLIDLTHPERPERAVDGHGHVRAATRKDIRLERIALVDAGQCSLVTVDLPRRVTGRRQEQALRWAAEEHLAGDADDQHVAPIGRDPDGRMRCVVVTAATMDRWLQALPALPDRLVPDAACLPWQPGELVLMRDGDAVLARWGPWTFDRIDCELLQSLLPDLLSAAGNRPRLVWYGADSPAWLPGERLETRPLPDDPLEILAGEARISPIDLMSGRYAAPAASRVRKRWLLAAGLAAAVAVLVLVHGLVELNLLKRESARLEQAIQQQVAEAFPQIGRVERPREQAERELARLRYGQSAGLLDLLGRSTPVVGSAPGVHVEAVSFRDGVLELALEVADVADMEALDSRLTALGLETRIQGLSIGPDGARGRIRVQGSGP